MSRFSIENLLDGVMEVIILLILVVTPWLFGGTVPGHLQLASTANTIHAVGDEVKEILFEFSPAVKGKAVWVDATTVEFRPDEWLKPLLGNHFDGCQSCA